MYVENLEMNNSLKWALFIKVSGQITSNTLWKRGEVFFLRIWRIFLFLRAVVNIPIQTLIIPPWLLLRKMIISQLELGPPVNKQVSIGDTSFSFLYEFITVVKKRASFSSTQEEPNKSLFQFLSQCMNYLARTKKKLIYAWVGAIPVCGEIHEWLQSLVARLNWLN